MKKRTPLTYEVDVIASIIASIQYMEPVKVIIYGLEGKVIMKL